MIQIIFGGMTSLLHRLPGRHGVRIQPEADPGHDDQHATGYVDSQQIVRELALERQVHSQTTVFT